MASVRVPLHGWRRLSKVSSALQPTAPHPTPTPSQIAAEEGLATTAVVQRHWDQVVPYVGHESALIWPIFRGVDGNSEPRPPQPPTPTR